MAENLLGYLNNVAMAERIGRALADEALAEAREGDGERHRRERQRKRRERMARVLRALAMRLTPIGAEPSVEYHASAAGR